METTHPSGRTEKQKAEKALWAFDAYHRWERRSGFSACSFGRENAVPLVDVTWYEGRSPEQKDELARAICEAFVEIGNARPDTVHVIFRDIDPAQWFKSAELLKEER